MFIVVPIKILFTIFFIQANESCTILIYGKILVTVKRENNEKGE